MQYLPRHLEKQILEASKYFKGLLLLGARQAGKSTLLTHLFPKIKAVVFDPIQDLYQARKDPELFLASFPAPLILDEVQYVPELLPALKRKMDQQEAKGQYFLTGSQNFSVLRTIAESMAGRSCTLPGVRGISKTFVPIFFAVEGNMPNVISAEIIFPFEKCRASKFSPSPEPGVINICSSLTL